MAPVLEVAQHSRTLLESPSLELGWELSFADHGESHPLKTSGLVLPFYSHVWHRFSDHYGGSRTSESCDQSGSLSGLYGNDKSLRFEYLA